MGKTWVKWNHKWNTQTRQKSFFLFLQIRTNYLKAFGTNTSARGFNLLFLTAFFIISPLILRGLALFARSLRPPLMAPSRLTPKEGRCSRRVLGRGLPYSAEERQQVFPTETSSSRRRRESLAGGRVSGGTAPCRPVTEEAR